MSRQFLSTSTQYCENTSWDYSSVPITLSAWVRSASGTKRVLTISNSTGSNVIASLVTNYPSTGFVLGQILVSGYSLIPNSSISIGTDTWAHIAFTVGGGEARVFANGVGGTAATYMGTPTASGNDRVSIGRLAGDTSQLFTGQVADAAVWDEQLTEQEIRDLASGRVLAAEIRPRALRGNWYLPSVDYGFTDRDWTGRGWTLTPTGSPTWGDDPPQLRQSRRKVWRVGRAPTNYTLTVDAASVSLTGQAVTLSAGRTATIGSATANLSGQAVAVSSGRVATIDNAAINATGQTVTVNAQRVAAVGNATVNASGQAVALSSARSVTVGTGEVQCAGQGVTLSAGRVCTVANGTAQVQGQAVGLSSARSVSVESGSVELSGQAAGVSFGRSVLLGNATVQVAGQGVLLSRAAALAISAATVRLEGQAVVLTWSGDVGDVDYSVTASSESIGRRLATEAASRTQATQAALRALQTEAASNRNTTEATARRTLTEASLRK